MVRQYETTFIINAHLAGDQIEAKVEKFKQLIEKNSGAVKVIDRWGKRRLAYEIAKKQYGYYVNMRFEAEGSFIKSLDKEFSMDDQILRYLTLLVPSAVLKTEDLTEKNEKKEEPSTDQAEDDAVVESESSKAETEQENSVEENDEDQKQENTENSNNEQV